MLGRLLGLGFGGGLYTMLTRSARGKWTIGRWVQIGLTAFVTAVLLLPGVTTAAPGQEGAIGCAARHDMLTFLDRQFNEQPTAAGVTADGKLVEVLSNDSGNWTLVISSPVGTGCILSAGQGWRQKPRRKREPML